MVFRDVLPSRKPCCTERDGWHDDFDCFSARDFGVERGVYCLIFGLNAASSRTGGVIPVLNVRSGLIIRAKQRWNLARRNKQAFPQTGFVSVALAAFQAVPADHSRNEGI